MIIPEFIAKSRAYLTPILDQNGAVVYSAASTLCPGKFYILGLNPGGVSGPTIRQCLDAMPTQENNAYLDEDWSSGRRTCLRGRHPLQRHLAALMQAIGADLRRVCASNLIFTRSSDQYGSNYHHNGSLCWQVHRLILGIVRPKVIIAFGNGAISPYAFLAQQHLMSHGIWPEETAIRAEYGSWQCKSFRTIIDARHILVLGLPHLSRYTVEGKPRIVGWVKKIMADHINV